eukprot:5187541-Pyramimonas_sp.AAC.1
MDMPPGRAPTGNALPIDKQSNGGGGDVGDGLRPTAQSDRSGWLSFQFVGAAQGSFQRAGLAPIPTDGAEPGHHSNRSGRAWPPFQPIGLAPIPTDGGGPWATPTNRHGLHSNRWGWALGHSNQSAWVPFQLVGVGPGPLQPVGMEAIPADWNGLLGHSNRLERPPFQPIGMAKPPLQSIGMGAAPPRWNGFVALPVGWNGGRPSSMESHPGPLPRPC